MENLKACYAKYIAQAESVQQDRPAWDGVLGIGSSMKTHPCHMEFYRSAEAWVDAFLKGTPTQQQAEAAVAYILETAEENRGRT